MAIKTYKKTDTTKLSKNFSVCEFSCHGNGCCTTVKIDEKLVQFLQKIRDHFGKAVTITSGYRCPEHNKSANGATSSRHVKGQAADIVVDGVAPAEVAKYAESIGILGIGLYETSKDGFFVHVDTRTEKSFWYGQKQEYRSTFGGTNPVKEWQLAAIADGFKFPSGADGIWGAECVSAARKAIVKRRLLYRYKNLTRIVQKAVGVPVDGKCGNNTSNAIKAYQKKHGLKPDGEVGLATWKVILNIQ
jgi:hypothetical protein